MGHLYFLCQPSTAHTAPVLDSQVISGAGRASAGPTTLETVSLGHRHTARAPAWTISTQHMAAINKAVVEGAYECEPGLCTVQW